ncbi:MAG: hypothetical protein AAGA57_05915 [Planctomycetota bacterium]
MNQATEARDYDPTQPAYPTQRMFCRGCGKAIFPVTWEPGRCLSCERAYDPRDKKTYRSEPDTPAWESGHATEWAWGCFLACYLGGLAVCQVVVDTWLPRVLPRALHEVLGGLAGLLAFWPASVAFFYLWMFACCSLLLAALSRWLSDELDGLWTRGALIGVLLSIPIAPAPYLWLLAGLIPGCLAGLFRRRYV